MAPRTSKPKIPALLKRAQEAQTREDLFSILKTLSSKKEAYLSLAPEIAEALAKMDISFLEGDEKVLAEVAIAYLKENNFVHPKVGVIIRLKDKQAKQALGLEEEVVVPESEGEVPTEEVKKECEDNA